MKEYIAVEKQTDSGGYIEVVSELVRCKDCKHRYMVDMVWQCPFGMPGGADFWCSYGAKRKEE